MSAQGRGQPGHRPLRSRALGLQQAPGAHVPGPFLVLGAAAGAMNPNSGSHPDPVANSVAERVTPGGARPVSEGDLSGLLPGSKE